MSSFSLIMETLLCLAGRAEYPAPKRSGETRENLTDVIGVSLQHSTSEE